jgi:hypothetical protein
VVVPTCDIICMKNEGKILFFSFSCFSSSIFCSAGDFTHQRRDATF